MNGLPYITDGNGRRTAVIVPIEEYEALVDRILEEVEDHELPQTMDDATDSHRVSRERIFELFKREMRPLNSLKVF